MLIDKNDGSEVMIVEDGEDFNIITGTDPSNLENSQTRTESTATRRGKLMTLWALLICNFSS